jgi:hypothetical protein
VTDLVPLLDVKEMLRREYEAIQKREAQEQAFKATARERGGKRVQKKTQGRQNGGGQGGKKKGFQGECFECKQRGHKKSECPRLKDNGGGEFVFFDEREVLSAIDMAAG